MNEWLAQHRPAAAALIDADRGLTIDYRQLREQVAAAQEQLQRHLDRGLVFLFAANTAEAIVLYLACLAARCPLVLLDPALSGERLELLVAAYDPAALLLPVVPGAPETGAARSMDEPIAGDAYRLQLRRTSHPASLHAELALLLTTSGSTGNPKLVRLTMANLSSNAHAIASYLGLEPGERCIQSLPIYYSYGLSLVNSHLVAGAAVVLTTHSFLRPEFWRGFDQQACTSFAGVPYVYETLQRLRFDPARHPSLRTMTQAGGALRAELIRSFHERTQAAGCRFFVMYGQTEATARIAFVPPARLGEKIGSIGVAIPGGELSLAALEASEQQELVYAGPNVMLGYAQGVPDLAAGDVCGGRLRTGDLARLDDDGFFYITGRLARFAKLLGRRVNLEDLEQELEAKYPLRAAAVERDGQLLVYTADLPPQIEAAAVARHLAGWLSVPPQYVKLQAVAEIPMTANGKKDYRALQS